MGWAFGFRFISIAAFQYGFATQLFQSNMATATGMRWMRKPNSGIRQAGSLQRLE
jgi:hypothetical protein